MSDLSPPSSTSSDKLGMVDMVVQVLVATEEAQLCTQVCRVRTAAMEAVLV